MVSEQWIGRDVEGSGRHAILGAVRVEWRQSGKGLNMKQSVLRPRCEPATPGHQSQLDIAFCGFSLESGCRRHCRAKLLVFWQSRPQRRVPTILQWGGSKGGGGGVVDPEALCILFLFFNDLVHIFREFLYFNFKIPTYCSAAVCSGWFGLKRESRKTLDIIVATKSFFSPPKFTLVEGVPARHPHPHLRL
jgi:hypothetical protein